MSENRPGVFESIKDKLRITAAQSKVEANRQEAVTADAEQTVTGDAQAHQADPELTVALPAVETSPTAPAAQAPEASNATVVTPQPDDLSSAPEEITAPDDEEGTKLASDGDTEQVKQAPATSASEIVLPGGYSGTRETAQEQQARMDEHNQFVAEQAQRREVERKLAAVRGKLDKIKDLPINTLDEAGLAALIAQENPKLTPQHVKSIAGHLVKMRGYHGADRVFTDQSDITDDLGLNDTTTRASISPWVEKSSLMDGLLTKEDRRILDASEAQAAAGSAADSEGGELVAPTDDAEPVATPDAAVDADAATSAELDDIAADLEAEIAAMKQDQAADTSLEDQDQTPEPEVRPESEAMRRLEDKMRALEALLEDGAIESNGQLNINKIPLILEQGVRVFEKDDNGGMHTRTPEAIRADLQDQLDMLKEQKQQYELMMGEPGVAGGTEVAQDGTDVLAPAELSDEDLEILQDLEAAEGADTQVALHEVKDNPNLTPQQKEVLGKVVKDNKEKRKGLTLKGCLAHGLLATAGLGLGAFFPQVGGPILLAALGVRGLGWAGDKALGFWASKVKSEKAKARLEKGSSLFRSLNGAARNKYLRTALIGITAGGIARGAYLGLKAGVQWLNDIIHDRFDGGDAGDGAGDGGGENPADSHGPANPDAEMRHEQWVREQAAREHAGSGSADSGIPDGDLTEQEIRDMKADMRDAQTAQSATAEIGHPNLVDMDDSLWNKYFDGTLGTETAQNPFLTNAAKNFTQAFNWSEYHLGADDIGWTHFSPHDQLAETLSGQPLPDGVNGALLDRNAMHQLLSWAKDSSQAPTEFQEVVRNITNGVGGNGEQIARDPQMAEQVGRLFKYVSQIAKAK